MPVPGWGSRHGHPRGAGPPAEPAQLLWLLDPQTVSLSVALAIILLIPVWLAGPLFSSPHQEEIFFCLERKLHFPQTLSSLTWLRLWKTKMRQFLLLLFFFKQERESLPRPAWQAWPLPASCHSSSPEMLSSRSLTHSGSFPPRALAQNSSFRLLCLSDTC